MEREETPAQQKMMRSSIRRSHFAKSAPATIALPGYLYARKQRTPALLEDGALTVSTKPQRDGIETSMTKSILRNIQKQTDNMPGPLSNQTEHYHS